MYIDRKGWFPIDPADVRKVVLEESLPIDSDKVKALRERLFGNWEMNWVGFNCARDFTLPGQQEPNRLPDISLCRNVSLRTSGPSAGAKPRCGPLRPRGLL